MAILSGGPFFTRTTGHFLAGIALALANQVLGDDVEAVAGSAGLAGRGILFGGGGVVVGVGGVVFSVSFFCRIVVARFLGSLGFGLLNFGLQVLNLLLKQFDFICFGLRTVSLARVFIGQLFFELLQLLFQLGDAAAAAAAAA